MQTTTGTETTAGVVKIAGSNQPIFPTPFSAAACGIIGTERGRSYDMNCLTANELAGNNPNDQKSFRKALRGAGLTWHAKKHAPWRACNAIQKQDMRRVYKEWRRKRPHQIQESPPGKRADQTMLTQGFDPIAGKDARAVILGTLPGGESLRLRQYYADSGNAFWFIVQRLFGIARGLTYDERVKGLIENRIAIWDVLQRAARSGSQDKDIVKGSEATNDFAAFFRSHPSIKDVFFNGRCPKKYFDKLVVPAYRRRREPHGSTPPYNRRAA